jgi:formamidopyrimidine-DNA glycosylase
MPELPEVETVCRTLRPLLVGHRIDDAHVLWDRTLANTSTDIFRDMVAGSMIEDVSRRAKFVRIHLDRGLLVTIHLRMTGELLYLTRPGDESDDVRASHLRVAFDLDRGARLLFYDVRKFGRIALLDREQAEMLDQALGPEPLSPTFTADTLFALLSARSRQIKPLLLDQSMIAGLGNIYVDEALHRARIHPLQPAHAVSPEQATILHAAIVSILEAAIEHHGTTLRNYRSGQGESGQNQRRLRIYGRAGEPCFECGTPIVRIVVGQRGTVYCPSCQPGIIAHRPDR